MDHHQVQLNCQNRQQQPESPGPQTGINTTKDTRGTKTASNSRLMPNESAQLILEVTAANKNRDQDLETETILLKRPRIRIHGGIQSTSNLNPLQISKEVLDCCDYRKHNHDDGNNHINGGNEQAWK